MEPEKKLTPAQAAALALRRAEEAVAMNAETHKLVKDMHQALMQPQHGYDKALIDRATEVVLEVEAGKIVGDKLARYAKVLGAILAIGAALGISTSIGGNR